jgi:subfamily B ATP-binding cassette protein MsbA
MTANPPTTLGSLLAYAAPYRLPLVFASLLLLAQSASSLVVPWLAGELTGALTAPVPPREFSIGVFVLLFTGVFTAQALFSFGSGYLMSYTGMRLGADLRGQLYDHVQTLPLAYFQQRRRGEILALLTRDVETLSRFITSTVASLAPTVFMFFGAMALMLRIDWRLGALASLLIPIFFIVIKWLARSIRPLAQQLTEEHAAAVATAGENLGMLPVIKAFTREAHESARFQAHLARILHLTRRQLGVQSALSPVTQLLAATGTILIMWLATKQVLSGVLEPGQLVSFLLYSLMLSRPASAMAATWGQVQHTRASVRRILNVLREPLEPITPELPDLPKARGDISFQNISFAYPGREPVLQDLSLEIPAGQTVAIIGPNGAGKSTLAHLLMRFHQPDAGNIQIDQTDIAQVNLHSLRRQIGLVTQRVLLFDGSVRDNIAYGLPQASEARIEQASRAAGAHEFVQHLPRGYDTIIGEEGIRLSGGQQQRLALARALLKDPPILILDEATAMYDPQAEKDFLKSCRQVFDNRTVILITHRPASLEVADQVLELKAGKII